MCLGRHQVAPKRDGDKKGCEIWITSGLEKDRETWWKRKKDRYNVPWSFNGFQSLFRVEIALHHLHTQLFFFIHSFVASSINSLSPCPLFLFSLVSISFSIPFLSLKTHQWLCRAPLSHENAINFLPIFFLSTSMFVLDVQFCALGFCIVVVYVHIHVQYVCNVLWSPKRTVLLAFRAQ